MRLVVAVIAAACVAGFANAASAMDWTANANHLIMVDGQGSDNTLTFDCNAAPIARFLSGHDLQGRPATEVDPELVVASGTDAPRTFAAKFDPASGEYMVGGKAARSLVVMALAQKDLTLQVDVQGERFVRTVFRSTGIDKVTAALAQCLDTPDAATAVAGQAPAADASLAPSAVPPAPAVAEAAPTPGPGAPPAFAISDTAWMETDSAYDVSRAAIGFEANQLVAKCDRDLRHLELALNLPLDGTTSYLAQATKGYLTVRGDVLHDVPAGGVTFAPARVTSSNGMLSITAVDGDAGFALQTIAAAKTSISVGLSLTPPKGKDGSPYEITFTSAGANNAISDATKGCPLPFGALDRTATQATNDDPNEDAETAGYDDADIADVGGQDDPGADADATASWPPVGQWVTFSKSEPSGLWYEAGVGVPGGDDDEWLQFSCVNTKGGTGATFYFRGPSSFFPAGTKEKDQILLVFGIDNKAADTFPAVVELNAVYTDSFSAYVVSDDAVAIAHHIASAKTEIHAGAMPRPVKSTTSTSIPFTLVTFPSKGSTAAVKSTLGQCHLR